MLFSQITEPCKMASILRFRSLFTNVVLILSLFVGFVHLVREECTYFGGGRTPKEAYGLSNCTWFRERACCLRTEVVSVFEEMPPLQTSNSECYEYMNQLMCYFCSPDQYLWYDIKLSVCKAFCNNVYEHCKDAKFNGTAIGSAFKDGKSFCEAQDFIVVEDGSCFTYEGVVSGMPMTVAENFIFLFTVLECMLFSDQTVG